MFRGIVGCTLRRIGPSTLACVGGLLIGAKQKGRQPASAVWSIRRGLAGNRYDKPAARLRGFFVSAAQGIAHLPPKLARESTKKPPVTWEGGVTGGKSVTKTPPVTTSDELRGVIPYAKLFVAVTVEPLS